MRAHQGYVNVHSTNFGGGEIRGQLGVGRPVDNDGDGRTDFSVLRFPSVPVGGIEQITTWNLNSTSGVQVLNWGDALTDFPAPGDYDGDGKADIAVYRAGATAGDQSKFYIFRSSDNTAQVVAYGLGNDTACARDYDGDGKTDPAIFRSGASFGAQAYYWVKRSTTNSDLVVAWGTTGDGTNSFDVPAPGDYDGDGKFDFAIYRFGQAPLNTYIILRSSDQGVRYQQWGNFNTDYVVPGDYDGDGKTDFCAVRVGSGSAPMVWWILQSSTGTARVQTFGLSSDKFIQGDYDGDGRTDIAVYRAGANASTNSTFWWWRSLDNTSQALVWGLGGDFPVASFDAR